MAVIGMKRLLIYAFDYIESDKLSLQSTVNDIHFIWTLGISKYLLTPEDVMIIGSVDLKGKILPWKHRCFLDSKDYFHVVEEFLNKCEQLLVYFTGHGTQDGCILYGSDLYKRRMIELIPANFLYGLQARQTWIIADMCYSHLFTDLFSDQHYPDITPTIFIPTSRDHPIVISMPRGSIFTVELVRILLNDEEHFFEWLDSNEYHHKSTDTLPFTSN